MRWFAIKIIFLLSLAIFVSYSIGEGATRIVVVGDTGTGERAYGRGLWQYKKPCANKTQMPCFILEISFTNPNFFQLLVLTVMLKKSKRPFRIHIQ
ncbi:MAG: hypothetical protein Ct9H300mP23_08110 [Nitrospinota bacterium]|nr:MAG: hypothetical protein Ct9H300mP23_08110 [Nitrospinota bacterium]